MNTRSWTRILRRLRRLPSAVGQKLYALQVHSLIRSENPYATHLPVLIGLAQLMLVRRVLEFGSGQYSTLAFLNLQAFPDIMVLHTLEDDPKWASRIKALLHNNPRITLSVVPSPIAQAVSSIANWNYDLVFIDDSLNVAARAATIQQVMRLADRHTVIAIHDYEIPDYRRAARIWPSRFVFSGFTPHVGVVWRDAALDRQRLHQLDLLIARHVAVLRPDDIAGWVRLLNEKLR